MSAQALIQESPRRQQMTRLRHIVTRNQLTLVGIVILVVATIVALFPSFFATHEPLALDLPNRLMPPSADNYMGTDDFGRDIYSRIVYGAQLSLFTAVLVVIAGAVTGSLAGMIAGYSGGMADETIMRVADMVLAFPAILLAMVIVATMGPSLPNAMLTLVIIGWPEYARVARSQTLVIVKQEYVMAARSIGTPHHTILLRHVLPNSLPPMIVQATINFGVTILALAALGFLGLGAQQPAPEWGLMISNGRNYFLDAWWFPVFPGLAIAIVTLGFNFLGDGLRDMIDPLTQT
jgi:peptide/nickel transport system permease protein